MTNLCIIDYNAANIATVTASSSASPLVASNLLTDIKSQVWRSTSRSAQLTATWTNLQLVNSVILPHTNLTNSATMRVRGYINSSDVPGVATPVFDTTTLPCCNYSSATAMGWDVIVPGVANFGYGGGVYARLFFTEFSVRKLYIELVDTANVASYIEAARLVIGDYWMPEYNADYGLQLSYKDSSSHSRNDAGDLLTDVYPRSKSISFSLSDIGVVDREKLMKILRKNGLSTPIYISIFPQDNDKNKEQDYQIYGKLSQLSAIILPRYSGYSTSITIEEI